MGAHLHITTNSIRAIMLAGIFALSCQKEEPVVPEEGTYGKSLEITIPSERGTYGISIISDGNWHASLSDETGIWVSFNGNTDGSGCGKVSIECKWNTGFPRKGAMFISSDTRATIDTIFIRQYGITPHCSFLKDSIALSCTAQSTSVVFDSNIPECDFGKINMSIIYNDKVEGWMNASMSGDMKLLNIDVLDNKDFNRRSARITMSYTDDWGDTYSAETNVVQSMPGGSTVTATRSFADIRGLVSPDVPERLITDDIAIEGYIISDRDSQNTGDCPELSASLVDYTENDRTAFIENSDATMGFRLIFPEASDNITERYSKTKLWLKGTILRYEPDPDRYTISGLGSDSYISVTAGDAASIPSKKKHIADLTDNDIYTYVTLEDCEFPIRRGGLIMFYNTAYTERMTKYAQVIADINGDATRLLFNLNSSIATSATGGVPKGRGPVSGVVVHEKYLRLNPADGNMGRYQIRNMSASDIAVSQSATDSFSEIITEWADNSSDGTERRVRPSSYGYTVSGDPWVIKPTAGIGAYYFYNITSPTSGQWPVVSSGWCSDSGFGAVSNAIYGFNSWWNKTAKDYNYAIWEFPTKDISSNVVTFCLAGRGHAANGGIPYWFLDYSTDKGKTWKRVGEFTVPAQSAWSPTTQGTITAETPSFFKIPNEILGLDSAMIRMIPSRDIMGNSKAWDGARISDGSASAYLDLCYSAIRYGIRP